MVTVILGGTVTTVVILGGTVTTVVILGYAVIWQRGVGCGVSRWRGDDRGNSQ